jgi:hypothetical protein
MTIRPSAAPDGLSDASTRLWAGLVSDLAVLRGDVVVAQVDLIRLGDLLRVRDRLDAVAASIAAEGVTVEGSTGQRTRNPLLEVEAKLRGEWADGLAGLGLWSGDHDVTVTRDGRLSREETE